MTMKFFCGGFDYVEEENTLIDVRIFVTICNPIVNYPDGREEPNLNLKVFHLEPLHNLPDLTTACPMG
jgi:hypothetical protein